MAEQDDGRRRRTAVLCWFVALAAAGCLVSWLLASRPAAYEPLVAADSSTTGGGADLASGSGKAVLVPTVERRSTFDVRVGDVASLYPGARKQLPVTLHNPQRYGVRVYRMRVTGRSLTAGCASSSLGTGTYRVSIILRPRATYRTHLNLGLRPTATDSCQGARWRVTVTATAVKR